MEFFLNGKTYGQYYVIVHINKYIKKLSLKKKYASHQIFVNCFFIFAIIIIIVAIITITVTYLLLIFLLVIVMISTATYLFFFFFLLYMPQVSKETEN